MATVTGYTYRTHFMGITCDWGTCVPSENLLFLKEAGVFKAIPIPRLIQIAYFETNLPFLLAEAEQNLQASQPKEKDPVSPELKDKIEKLELEVKKIREALEIPLPKGETVSVQKVQILRAKFDEIRGFIQQNDELTEGQKQVAKKTHAAIGSLFQKA